ncbi:hypothetical protein NONO_c59640 [Nocardia nova SH22a]|uniref:Uncharacterized protein n=1 Tax=Nocardia nova SH22a TaxID=1415166 RepID=W5TN09_9NOCA|nr:hypothetical protein NONO_c59640 [Nocardia nova SH22a]
MRCHDCGHRAHGGEDCIECSCPTFRDPMDAVLRERPRKSPFADEEERP